MDMEMNLNTLNSLRTTAGMKPLKAWKASKAAMAAAAEKILKAQPKRPSEVAMEAASKGHSVTTDQLMSGDLGFGKVAKAKKVTSEQTISIADIARAMNVDQKVARAKLRRLYASQPANTLPKPVGEGWTFAVSDESKLRNLLTTDRRVHAE
jgi:hypothetical protein